MLGSTNAAGTTESFDGGGGNDTIDGRGGFDQAYYNNAVGTVSGISVDMAAGTVVGDVSIGTDTLRSIESVRGTNFADTYDATGFGQAGALNIGSNGTFNEFEGMGGNDVITGNGNTRMAFFNATGGVTVDIAAGTATGDASVGTDTFTGVTQVRGSNFNDTMSGDANNNSSTARAATTRSTAAAAMTPSPAAGADTFVYADNGGADMVTDFSHGQGDKIDLTGVTGIYSLADVQAIAAQVGPNTVINFGVGNTLTLNNVTLANLTASDFIFANPSSHIVGDNNDNVLVGTSATDWIQGLGGNDMLQGLAGNDLLDGGTGIDRAIYTDATGPITVDLAAGTVSGRCVGRHRHADLDRADPRQQLRRHLCGDRLHRGEPDWQRAGELNEFEGMAGDDVITGNGGTQLSYLNATAGVTVNFTSWVAGQGASGTATGDASVGTDTFTGVQAVRGSEFDDTIHGQQQSHRGGGVPGPRRQRLHRRRRRFRPCDLWVPHRRQRDRRHNGQHGGRHGGR